MADVIETVNEGEMFIYTTHEASALTVVKPSCEIDRGNWYCAEHGGGFANNLMWQNHLDEPGKHRAVWMCIEHGPEVP